MRETGIVLFVGLLLLIMFSSCGYAAITRASPLLLGKTLSSPGGSYELGFFSPNNSKDQYIGIWFKKITPKVVVWVANREKPVTDSMANLTISRNGSLILLDSRQDVVWSSGKSFTSEKCHAELLDTGNLVIIDDVSRKILWQSFDNLGDTMLPSSSLMYDLSTSEKRVLTSWKSQTDPSPGDFVVQIMPQVPAQVFTMKGSTPYGRSGPWAKTGFAGVPEMDESYANPFIISQDVGNGTGYFSFLQRNSQLKRVIITPEGTTKNFHYNGTDWVLEFESPANSCDIYGACGAFGLCISPKKCNCLKGFVPKYTEDWKKGNKSSGCVRRSELTCQGKDRDVFYRMENVKPPDFYEYASFIDEDQCHQRCLSNCSCTAFSYVTGIGCLVWSQELLDTVQFSVGGGFLSIRLASSELGGSRRTKIIASTTISLSIFIILAFASYRYWRYRAKQTAQVFFNTMQDSWKNGLEAEDISGLKFFEMNTIRTATNNFNISNKLGQGGFGPVYKGKLPDRKEIAVKRLFSSSGQGTEEFMNEIKLISKLQHRNLVRLLGCCIDGEEKLLIYEFMVNKSLDTFLFDLRLKLEIDWPKRFNIIQGIARGLLYLHRDSCLRVIHRDLKVSNILVDENMNPKISDFGLARMFQGTQHQDNTHRIAGTLGYMSPEYAWTGMFSEKSDIYAFGVLQLEIISGKKISRFIYGEEDKNLLKYAWESWCKTSGVDLLDQDISSSCSPVEVARCVQISLLCIQQQPLDRPSCAQVVSMLTTTIDIPRPKQPVFALQIQDQDQDGGVSESVNDITQTALHGR